MFLHSTVPETLPSGDPIALAIFLGVLAIFAVLIFLRNLRRHKPEVLVPAPEPKEPPAAVLPEAPGSAGKLKLYNVEPKTAAMLMAIVADKMGKPLNELRFLSIKEVE